MPARYDKKGKHYTKKVTKDKVKVTIHTSADKLSGYLHVQPDKRLSDSLNDSAGFVALTEGEILSSQSGELRQFEFMALNLGHVVWVIEEEEREPKDTPGDLL